MDGKLVTDQRREKTQVYTSARRALEEKLSEKLAAIRADATITAKERPPCSMT